MSPAEPKARAPPPPPGIAGRARQRQTTPPPRPRPAPSASARRVYHVHSTASSTKKNTFPQRDHATQRGSSSSRGQEESVGGAPVGGALVGGRLCSRRRRSVSRSSGPPGAKTWLRVPVSPWEAVSAQVAWSHWAPAASSTELWKTKKGNVRWSTAAVPGRT